MLYPVYKNGPYVVVPLSNDLGIPWIQLTSNQVSAVKADQEFEFILAEESNYLCVIDVRKDNHVFLIDRVGNILMQKSLKDLMEVNREPYELVLYRESIDFIRLKGKNYIKENLVNSLFCLLNDKLELGLISLEVHSAILREYQRIVDKCAIE